MKPGPETSPPASAASPGWNGRVASRQVLSVVLLSICVGLLQAEVATPRSWLEGLNRTPQAPVGFTELQFSPLLKSPAQSRGQLWIEPDGTLVMQLDSPRSEQRRLSGDQMILRRPAPRQRAPRQGAEDPDAPAGWREHRISLDEKRAAHLILLAVSKVLQGDLPWLAVHFDSSSSTAAGSDPQTALSKAGQQPEPALVAWEVLLVPRDTAVLETLAWIRLQGTGTRLERLRADRGSAGWQQYDFFPLP